MLNYIAIQVIAWADHRARCASPAPRSPGHRTSATRRCRSCSGRRARAPPRRPDRRSLAVPIIWWLLYRSTLGFEIRTVGANPDAARYAGMRPRPLIVLDDDASAACWPAWPAPSRSSASQRYMPAAYATNVGFDAITVALLGRANPVGILFAALLLGAMRAGAAPMQIQAGVPVEMIDVLQGVILFFLAADVIVRRVFRLRGVEGGVGRAADDHPLVRRPDHGAVADGRPVRHPGPRPRLPARRLPGRRRHRQRRRSSSRSPRRSPSARCAAS